MSNLRHTAARATAAKIIDDILWQSKRHDL